MEKRDLLQLLAYNPHRRNKRYSLLMNIVVVTLVAGTRFISRCALPTHTSHRTHPTGPTLEPSKLTGAELGGRRQASRSLPSAMRSEKGLFVCILLQLGDSSSRVLRFSRFSRHLFIHLHCVGEVPGSCGALGMKPGM